MSVSVVGSAMLNAPAPTSSRVFVPPPSVANYQTALDSVSYSSTSTSPSAAGADNVRTISWQASYGAASSNTVASTIDVGEIYNLTTGPDTIQAGAGNDIITATSGTLSTSDQIDASPCRSSSAPRSRRCSCR
jgi:hypothetical protein